EHRPLLKARLVLANDSLNGSFSRLTLWMNDIKDERILAHKRAIGGFPLPRHLPGTQALRKARRDDATQKRRPLLDGDDTHWPGGSEIQQLADRTLLTDRAYRLARCGTTRK